MISVSLDEVDKAIYSGEIKEKLLEIFKESYSDSFLDLVTHLIFEEKGNTKEQLDANISDLITNHKVKNDFVNWIVKKSGELSKKSVKEEKESKSKKDKDTDKDIGNKETSKTSKTNIKKKAKNSRKNQNNEMLKEEILIDKKHDLRELITAEAEKGIKKEKIDAEAVAVAEAGAGAGAGTEIQAQLKIQEQPSKIEEAKVSKESKLSQVSQEADQQNQNSEQAVLPKDEENENKEEDKKGNIDKEKKIRCRKWPTCNDEECKFHHPTESCPYFPKCKFKDKCLYIHPNITCKYGSMCSRLDCAYAHPPSQMMIPSMLSMMMPNMKYKKNARSLKYVRKPDPEAKNQGQTNAENPAN